MKKSLNYTFLIFSVLFVFSTKVLAAPGVLQDLPHSVGAYVQPNILFLVDDSGSMDWEILKSNGALDHYPANRNSGNIDITPTPSDHRELLESCSWYNVMYYDPNRTYTPWIGEDSDGIAYANQTHTAARINPYNPAEGTVDLTASDCCSGVPGYIPGNDLDSDGYFDPGECTDNGTVADMYTTFVSIHDMTVEQQTNFANWYSYYRKREYVAKRALSEIITDSTARVGLATLHNNNSVGTLVQDIDNLSQPIDPQAQTNKASLLENLFLMDSSGGTPLRSRLDLAGQYFSESGTATTVSNLFGGSASPSTHSGTVNATTPILSSANGGVCQQNFTVMFSDGYWNSDTGFAMANHDGAINAGEIAGLDEGTFADTQSNTLADIAMRYYEFDLATLANGLTLTDPHQENVSVSHQHMVTYSVAFGVNGTLEDNPDISASSFAWPVAVSNTLTTVDDMRHAAWNGRGQFLSAGDPDSLISSLSDAVQDIEQRVGTATSASFNSGTISSDTLVFQSRFRTDDWSGDLLAFRFDNDGVVEIVNDGIIDENDSIWSAAEELQQQVEATNGPANRSIVTFNGTQGVPFLFPSNYGTPGSVDSNTISQTQIDDLLTNRPAAVSEQNYGDYIVNYFRGDNTHEVGSGASGGLNLFRNRGDRYLSALIHSNPQYSGVPAEPYPNLIEGVGNEYSTFKTAQETRRPLVFVGGNGGMLQAFYANDPILSGTGAAGREAFAYIPGTLLSNPLNAFAETDYSHLSYVDGTPTIRDVFIDGQWRTYLVGGLRTGGRGIYVLDVTDPTVLANQSNAAAIVVDEFTDSNLGFTFSRPQIAKMNNGRWAAIFGNGYNNDVTGDGRARLYILFLDDGTFIDIEASESGINYISNNSCFDAASNCNGLSSPALADIDGDYRVDRVYAGDLHGNMWVFNLESSNADDWDNSSSLSRLVTACESASSSCPLSERQPITTKPVIQFHPNRRALSTEPNIMVFFGTGQLIAINDNTSTNLQTFYGVWDAGANHTDLTKLNLNEQSFTSSLRVSADYVNYSTGSGGQLGWYIDLTIPSSNALLGGRSVNTPLLLGDIIFFLVSVPDDAVCAGGGASFIAALEAFDGSESDFHIYLDDNGTPNSSAPLVLQNDSVVGIGSIDDKVVSTNDDGGINDETVVTKGFIPAGRKSWSIIK